MFSTGPTGTQPRQPPPPKIYIKTGIRSCSKIFFQNFFTFGQVVFVVRFKYMVVKNIILNPDL